MMRTPLGWGADDRVGFVDGPWCRNFGEVNGVGLAGGDYAIDYVINYSNNYANNYANSANILANNFAIRSAGGFAFQPWLGVVVQVGFESSAAARKEDRREPIRPTPSPRVRKPEFHTTRRENAEGDASR